MVTIDTNEVDEHLKHHPQSCNTSSADILEIEQPDIKPSLATVIVLSSDDENYSPADQISDPPSKRLRRSPIKKNADRKRLDQARILRTCVTIRTAIPDTLVGDRKTRGRKSSWANELTARLIAKRIRNTELFENDIVNEHIIYILTHLSDLPQAVRALAVILWGGDELAETQIAPPVTSNSYKIKSELPHTQEFHDIWKEVLAIEKWEDDQDQAVKDYFECLDKLNKRLNQTRLLRQ